MRRYFLTSALLYLAFTPLLILRLLRPQTPILSIVHDGSPLLAPPLLVVYAALFLATGGIKAAAAFTESTRIRLVAVMAGAGLSTFWTAISAYLALFYHGEIYPPLLWAYVAYMTYQVLPVVTLPPERLSAMRNALHATQQTAHETVADLRERVPDVASANDLQDRTAGPE